MYKDDVNIHLKDNRDEKRHLLWDFITIYIKMRIFLPKLVNERDALVKLAQGYYSSILNEDEILRAIKECFGQIDDSEEIDELFEELDDMYQDRWEYYQKVFLDYESVISDYDDFIGMIQSRIIESRAGREYNPGSEQRHRFIPGKVNFPIFDEDYKQKTIGKIKMFSEDEKL